MKVKDFINGITQKIAGSRGAAITNLPAEKGKYAFVTEWFYNPIFGVPRSFNPTTLREFAGSVWVRQCVDTITEEVANTDWDITPKEKYKDNYNETKLNEIKDFFRFPNKDEDLSVLLKKLMEDILVLDSGVIVKTFDTKSYENNKTKYSYSIKKQINGQTQLVEEFTETKPLTNKVKLLEMYAVDGASFLIEPDMHGRLFTDKPTYFQYNFSYPGGRPMPFWKREVVFFKINPKTNSIYGMSPIQSIINVVESLNNATRFNKKFFEEWAIPAGLMCFEGMPDDDLKAIKEEWKKEFKSKPWKMAFSSYKIDWQQFTMSNTEMQWLDGMKFYQKLVMAVYHINQSELGYTDELNKHSSQVQSDVFLRKCIKPILNMLKSKFDNEIIQEFYDGDAEVEFTWKTQDLFEEQRKVNNNIIEVKAGIKTINEVRNEMGLDPVEWGDEPFNSNPGFGGFIPKEERELTLNQRIELKKKANFITENKEQVLEFDKFLDNYYKDIETKLLSKLNEVNLNKSIKKNFSELWRYFISLLQTTKELTDKLFNIIKQDFNKGIDTAEKQLNLDLGYNFDRYNPRVEQLTKEEIDGYTLPDGTRWFGIKGLNRDLTELMHQTITDAIKEGKGNKEIAKDISKVFKDFEGYKAMRITRTESNRILNMGTNNAYIESGLKGKKQWLAKIDDRTSDICRELDGQKVELTGFFETKDGKQFYHPPGHCNCRSTIVFIPEEEE